MNTILYRTMDGMTNPLIDASIEAFSNTLRGAVITPDDSDYDSARALWNGMVDRHPALIARCVGNRDVRHAVNFARDNHMLLSVRGGGHHIAGNAAAEGGLMIDLSRMRSVHVNPLSRTARVDSGALLGDIDHETQGFGLATPLGINSTTGIAGLCLGGGFGWLTRKHGLTADNLLSADIVTADGELHRVSASQEPDLFWAIRGGGGNFGVATSFELQLHPVGPEVHSGLVVYPFDEAGTVLRAWRDFTLNAPDELSVWAILRKAPPLPFLPESIHGKDVVVLAVVYAGDMAEGERAARPLLNFGSPVGQMLTPHPYTAFQAAFDPLLTAGARNYWKSHNVSRLSDEALDTMIEAAACNPGPECEIFIAQLGGAMSRVGITETAYTGRDAQYVMNVHARWRDAVDDAICREWARRTFNDMAPYATGGGYVNFLTEDEGERVSAAYGVNYPRLQMLKRRYDPDNLFRMNLNIVPGIEEAVA